MTNLLGNRSATRRSVLQTGAAWLGAAFGPCAAWGQSVDDDALQHWIERNAVSVNPERLIKAIGNARIVMLGEPSHGAGNENSKI